MWWLKALTREQQATRDGGDEVRARAEKKNWRARKIMVVVE